MVVFVNTNESPQEIREKISALSEDEELFFQAYSIHGYLQSLEENLEEVAVHLTQNYKQQRFG